MSSAPLRKTEKVQSLRTYDLDRSGKGMDASGFLAKAVSLHLGGKREEALKELQRAVAAGETSPEIYVAMGHIQFELGQFEPAANSYRSLVQSKPQHTTGWFNLAVCLERLGAW